MCHKVVQIIAIFGDTILFSFKFGVSLFPRFNLYESMSQWKNNNIGTYNGKRLC